MTIKDPLYAEWNELLTMYAQTLNPACFYSLREVDTGSPEYKADVAMWADHVAEVFEELTR